MPFVSVPKDLSKVKTKIVFNLTKRQLICFFTAGLIGIPTYLFTRSYIGNEIAVLLMVGLMLPFFFLAMYEHDGQTLEKIIYNILCSRFFRPKVRYYQTCNLYRFLNKTEVLYEKQSAKKAGTKTATKYQAAKGIQKRYQKCKKGFSKRKR